MRSKLNPYVRHFFCNASSASWDVSGVFRGVWIEELSSRYIPNVLRSMNSPLQPEIGQLDVVDSWSRSASSKRCLHQGFPPVRGEKSSGDPRGSPADLFPAQERSSRSFGSSSQHQRLWVEICWRQAVISSVRRWLVGTFQGNRGFRTSRWCSYSSPGTVSDGLWDGMEQQSWLKWWEQAQTRFCLSVIHPNWQDDHELLVESHFPKAEYVQNRQRRSRPNPSRTWTRVNQLQAGKWRPLVAMSGSHRLLASG